MASSSSSSAEEAIPPWEKLPPEVTATILRNLGPVEILLTARKVSPTWRSVTQDPSMWRCIDMEFPAGRGLTPPDVEDLCRQAVDLSRGQLTDIKINGFGTDELLEYIFQRSSKLRRVELVKCYGVKFLESVTEAVKNVPLLEEMHLCQTCIGCTEAIETFGRSCPLLKSFRMNRCYTDLEDFDDEAIAIAENMPGLHHLELVGNRMTDEGLKAILDGCPNLESLDLRSCPNVEMDCIEKVFFERIEDIKLLHDSINENFDDYPCYGDIEFPDYGSETDYSYDGFGWEENGSGVYQSDNEYEYCDSETGQCYGGEYLDYYSD